MGYLSHIMNECCAHGMLGVLCGKPGERWVVFDGRPNVRQLYTYESNEVEHVTCTGDAERPTPDRTVPG
jgi:hypothetical protein